MLADRFVWRMPVIVVFNTLVVIAYSILFAKASVMGDNTTLCYFSICLACVGLYLKVPACNAWTVHNLYGPGKRAMDTASMI